MKKPNRRSAGEERILPDYDFAGGVRGKHAASYAKGTNIVVLDPDVARVFRNSRNVNRVLRSLAQIAKSMK